MSNKERKALGRGFSALIKPVEPKEKDSISSQNPDNDMEEGFFHIPISSVYPNPKQPRKTFDEEKLLELSQSIKIKGVIQPITVRRRKRGKGEYELIAGERRLKASKLAGLEKYLRSLPIPKTSICSKFP